MAKPNAGSDLRISDIIDVIERDPDYTGHPQPNQNIKDKSDLKIGAQANVPAMNTTASLSEAGFDGKQKPFVKIIEQPASKALRFRYEVEGRSAGSLPGVNSSTENKTYPTIQVVGYKGKAVVVVSCVTKDFPYKPHPHSLVGKEGCKKGVCTLEINNETMVCMFSNLGVQCVKKKGIEEALKLREEIRVDPFHTGFSHKNQPQTIDLNVVRLCFQVFLEGAQKGKFTLALKPVVSEPIYDKKAISELTICKLSDCSSPVNGGKDIILLCDKVTKDDIQVVFYQEEEGQVVWEANGDFSASDVHKQVAISFRTPRYKTNDIEDAVSVFIQLRRPSDGACSEPRRFDYLPLDSGTVDANVGQLTRSPLFANKRLKPDFSLYSHILSMDAAALARQMFSVTSGVGDQSSDVSVQCSLPTSADIESKVVSVEVGVQTVAAVEAQAALEVFHPSDGKSVGHSRVLHSPSGVGDSPPPLPEKGIGFEKMKGNLMKASDNVCNRNLNESSSKSAITSLHANVFDLDPNGRLSVASSEDLNSRLSAAFSDYSDLTDIRSIAEASDVDINDTLSMISSAHTLNGRLSQMSDMTDVSVSSDETVIRESRSLMGSIDTIEKQLEILEAMSLDPDNQTYSSFQMAMKHPIFSWPGAFQAKDCLENSNEQVYDDPADGSALIAEIASPVVPPRVESMTVPTPPLPPRRFKKFNQPLPDPPIKDAGLKSALQAIKQTFKKAKPVSQNKSSTINNPISSSPKSVDNNEESLKDDQQDVSKIHLEPNLAANDCDVSPDPKSTEITLDPSDSLTEAENFALYMTLAPLATASEFDDNETMSMLYAELNAVSEVAPIEVKK